MSTRKVSVRVVLATIILVGLFALYLVLDQSSWAYDDNFFLVLAGQEGFTWHWLSSVQFEHWDIGEHVVISLQHWLFFLTTGGHSWRCSDYWVAPSICSSVRSR